MSTDRDRPDSKWFAFALAAVFVTGLAARVAGAWHMRCITDPDSSVVALMVKHMAQGIAFPCFFYGQLYMGSFEPAVSALLCKIFGVSGFMVNLGTALVAALLLPVVYVWGRDAGGRVAGLAAAAFCIVGSPAFFPFQFNPRGGYAAVLVLGALVMWMAGRLAAGQRDGYRPSCFSLGLAAGFAWWVDPLIIMALVAACVVLLAGLRTEALKPRFWFPGLLGFFLGGAPFWIWNSTHEWAGVVALVDAESRVLSEGFVDFLSRAQRATGLAGLSPVAWWLTLALFGVSAAYAVVRLFDGVRKRTADLQTLSVLAAVVMILSAFFIFSTSQFSMENTARYLLPMVPAVAVLVGLFVAACAKRHPALAVVPMAVVALMQAPTLRAVTRNDALAQVFNTVVPRLQELLPTYGVRTAYVSFQGYPLNFHTDEAFDFPLIEHERSVYLIERAESDPSPAFMTAHNEIGAFLETAGGTAERGDIAGVTFLYNLKPPVVAWEALPATAFLDGTSSDGATNVAELIDNARSSFWYFRKSDSERKWAEIRLREPREVCGLRMACPGGRLTPGLWSIEGQLEDGTWKTLLRDTMISGFFWSGPRPYLSGRYDRHEARVETTRLQAVRIVFPAAQKGPRWAISELTLFTPSAAIEPEGDANVAPLVQLLRERRVQVLYADRWVANEVWRRSSGTIETSRETPHRPGERAADCPVMEGRSGLGVLVRKDGAKQTRDVFGQAGLRCEETDIGPWILFDRFSGSATNVEWAGFAAMLK